MKHVVVTASLLAAVCIAPLFAQQRPRRVETADDPTKHHQDVTVHVATDQPAVFTLTASNSPVRMDVSAVMLGDANGAQPNPILRSATLLHTSITDETFFTHGDDPPVPLTQSGIAFANHPGADGLRMTIALGLPAARAGKQIQVSVPDPISGFGQQFFNQIDVRISLWY